MGEGGERGKERETERQRQGVEKEREIGGGGGRERERRERQTHRHTDKQKGRREKWGREGAMGERDDYGGGGGEADRRGGGGVRGALQASVTFRHFPRKSGCRKPTLGLWERGKMEKLLAIFICLTKTRNKRQCDVFLYLSVFLVTS